MIWGIVVGAALLAVGFGLGWPWGVVVVAGCLILPYVVMRLLLRYVTMYRDHRLPAGQTVRARVITLTPDQIVNSRAELPEAGGEVTK